MLIGSADDQSFTTFATRRACWFGKSSCLHAPCTHPTASSSPTSLKKVRVSRRSQAQKGRQSLKCLSHGLSLVHNSSQVPGPPAGAPSVDCGLERQQRERAGHHAELVRRHADGSVHLRGPWRAARIYVPCAGVLPNVYLSRHLVGGRRRRWTMTGSTTPRFGTPCCRWTSPGRSSPGEAAGQTANERSSQANRFFEFAFWLLQLAGERRVVHRSVCGALDRAQWRHQHVGVLWRPALLQLRGG